MMLLERVWPAQAAQNALDLSVLIDGDPDWRSYFAGTIRFGKRDRFWIHHFDRSEVPFADYLAASAELTGSSFERCAMGEFIDRGFELLELEVEFSDREIEGELNSRELREWGVCSWYTEHRLYKNPLVGFEKLHPKWTPFIRSVFKTEHAEDQEFTLLSQQMFVAAKMGWPPRMMLNRSLLYRKAVFSSRGQLSIAKAA